MARDRQARAEILAWISLLFQVVIFLYIAYVLDKVGTNRVNLMLQNVDIEELQEQVDDLEDYHRE